MTHYTICDRVPGGVSFTVRACFYVSLVWATPGVFGASERLLFIFACYEGDDFYLSVIFVGFAGPYTSTDCFY